MDARQTIYDVLKAEQKRLHILKTNLIRLQQDMRNVQRAINQSKEVLRDLETQIYDRS